MAASGSALANLIKSSVDTRMSAVSGVSPLAQKNPSYFTALCLAIGTGIISGGPSISFTTTDTGSKGTPAVAGVGSGVGITTDPSFFVQDLYTRIRGYVLADFGKTTHDAYPPSPGNSGNYLLALCNGINDAFLSYYPTAWTLVSAHPAIYGGAGVISNGHFSGLTDTSIASSIVSASPTLVGPFWPRIAQAVSESYVALIEQHSTGTVAISGTCIPSSSQVCGVSGSGSGTGIAT
jgi:hypothetical protein